MTIPSVRGVLETCLYSSDLPRAVRFYRDELGLRLLESGERLCVFSVTGQQVLLIFRSGGTQEAIPTPGGVIPPHEASGHLHFAFAISKEDFPKWENYLIARGIPTETKVKWPTGGQSLYFRDPDNHLVELATPGLWKVY
jgi:catechol 2,3-dioxygenase-like lactoylglutathione lyase family enzyme